MVLLSILLLEEYQLEIFRQISSLLRFDTSCILETARGDAKESESETISRGRQRARLSVLNR